MIRANAGMSGWAGLLAGVMMAIGCGGSPPAASASGAAGGSAPAAGSATGTGSGTGAATGTGSATGTGAGSATGSAPATGSASGAPAPAAPGDSPATPAPAAHPFAATAAEATSLIDDAITSRSNELGQCVDAARARRNSPHAKLVVEVGIDEEGHMLGVTLPKKEKHDQVFVDCVIAALRAAPFPKSHAGVITVRKTFEDKAVYR